MQDQQTAALSSELQAGQRPWLSVIAPSIDQPFVADQKLGVTFPVHNTGSTPTTIILQNTASSIDPAGTDFNKIAQDYEKLPISDEDGMVVPPQCGRESPQTSAASPRLASPELGRAKARAEIRSIDDSFLRSK